MGPVTVGTSSQNFRVSVVASGDGTWILDKTTDGYDDRAGNSSIVAFTTGTLATIDNTIPSLVITRNAVTLGSFTATTDNTVSFALAFDKPIDPTTFTLADITLNPTLTVAYTAPVAGDLTGGPTNFTFTVNGITGDGDLGITVGQNINDVAGNGPMAAAVVSAVFTIDNIVPTLGITRNAVTNGSFTQTSDNTVSFALAFSEPISGGTFDPTVDIALNKTGTVTNTAVVAGDLTGGTQNYTFTVNTIAGDGNLAITVGPNISDPAGNSMSGAQGPSSAFTFDHIFPFVSSITPVSPTSKGFSSTTGTATFTAASPAVTGSGTLFTSELFVGAVLMDAPGATTFGIVASIADDTNLTLVSGAPASLTGQYALQLYFTVTFNEPIQSSSISIADFVKNGSSTAGGSTINAVGPVTAGATSQLFRVSVTASSAGSWILDKTTNAFVDPAGNSATTAFTTGTACTIDNTVATLGITRNAVTLGTFASTTDNSVSFALAFDNPIDPSTFTIGDIVLNKTGTVANTAPVAGDLTGGPTNYTFTVNGIIGDGDLGITVGPNINDAAGNGPMAAASISAVYTIDNIIPTLTIARNPVTGGSFTQTSDNTASFLLTFSEAVNPATFTIADIVLNPTGTVSNAVVVAGDLTGGPLIYTFTVNTIIGDGNLGITVGPTISDPAGNNMSGAQGPSSTFTFDHIKPTLGIVRNPVTLGSFAGTTDNAVSFSLTFSEPVNPATFTIADIAINIGGTVTNTAPVAGDLTGGPTIYTFTVNGITGDGTLGITVGPSIDDPAPNTMLSAQVSALFAIDNTLPTLTVTRNAVTLGSFGGTTDNSVSFALAFDNPLNGATFTIADIVLNKTGTVANTAPVGGDLTGGPTNYTFTINGITGDGTLGITVGPSITDAAGNGMAAASISALYTIDNTVPTLTITRNPVTVGTFAQTSDNAESFAFAFSELMNNGTFTIADIVINNGGTVANTAPVAGNLTTADNINYNFNIVGITGDGTMSVTVGPTIQDASGNSMAVAQGPSSTFTFDHLGPTLTITRNATTLGSFAGTTDNTISFALAFNEVVNNGSFTIADIVLNTTGTVANTVPAAADLTTADNQNYTFTINGLTGDGNIGITVGPTISDPVNNLMISAQGPSAVFAIDNTLPTLAITRNAVTLGSFAATTDNTVTFALAFSESMNTATFATADITLNKTGTVANTAPVGGDITGGTITYT